SSPCPRTVRERLRAIARPTGSRSRRRGGVSGRPGGIDSCVSHIYVREWRSSAVTILAVSFDRAARGDDGRPGERGRRAGDAAGGGIRGRRRDGDGLPHIIGGGEVAGARVDDVVDRRAAEADPQFIPDVVETIDGVEADRVHVADREPRDVLTPARVAVD